jgi:hypothetical protein
MVDLAVCQLCQGDSLHRLGAAADQISLLGRIGVHELAGLLRAIEWLAFSVPAITGVPTLRPLKADRATRTKLSHEGSISGPTGGLSRY